MRFLFIMATIAIVTLVGCTRLPFERPRDSAPVEHSQPSASVKPPRASEPEKPPCCRSAKLAPSRAAIVRTAARFVGAKMFRSKGRRIAYDSASVTRAIFLEHGIDLYDSSESDPKANGVHLIYAHVRQHGTFHQGPVARPGDLVFFDNTWDSNGDGNLNDPLTHVGVVERVEPDGSVVFIRRVTGAVARYRMNLGLPHVHKTVDGRVLNDYMRSKLPTDPDDMGHLSGELFAFYGTRVSP